VTPHGQTVLVLQGGGALGAYQGGVYEALHEAGQAPVDPMEGVVVHELSARTES
jgi:NTE family protein